MALDIESFKRIYLARYGEELTDENAERKARMLLNLYLAVFRSPVDVVKDIDPYETPCKQN